MQTATKAPDGFNLSAPIINSLNDEEMRMNLTRMTTLISQKDNGLCGGGGGKAKLCVCLDLMLAAQFGSALLEENLRLKEEHGRHEVPRSSTPPTSSFIANLERTHALLQADLNSLTHKHELLQHQHHQKDSNSIAEIEKLQKELDAMGGVETEMKQKVERVCVKLEQEMNAKAQMALELQQHQLRIENVERALQREREVNNKLRHQLSASQTSFDSLEVTHALCADKVLECERLQLGLLDMQAQFDEAKWELEECHASLVSLSALEEPVIIDTTTTPPPSKSLFTELDSRNQTLANDLATLETKHRLLTTTHQHTCSRMKRQQVELDRLKQQLAHHTLTHDIFTSRSILENENRSLLRQVTSLEHQLHHDSHDAQPGLADLRRSLDQVKRELRQEIMLRMEAVTSARKWENKWRQVSIELHSNGERVSAGRELQLPPPLTLIKTMEKNPLATSFNDATPLNDAAPFDDATHTNSPPSTTTSPLTVDRTTTDLLHSTINQTTTEQSAVVPHSTILQTKINQSAAKTPTKQIVIDRSSILHSPNCKQQ